MTRTFYTKKINLRQILYQRPEYNGLVKLILYTGIFGNDRHRIAFSIRKQ